MATFEEASKCPRCHEHGRQGPTHRSGNPGNQVATFHCENSTCVWGSDVNDPGWIVEIDSEGNVFERKPNEKQYPKLNLSDEQIEQIQKQAEAASRPIQQQLPGVAQ